MIIYKDVGIQLIAFFLLFEMCRTNKNMAILSNVEAKLDF